MGVVLGPLELDDRLGSRASAHIMNLVALLRDP
jgi:hypothetical protein